MPRVAECVSLNTNTRSLCITLSRTSGRLHSRNEQKKTDSKENLHIDFCKITGEKCIKKMKKLHVLE